MSSPGILETQQRPRLLLVGGVVLLLLAAVLAWWRSTVPDPLPLSDQVVQVSVKVESPVFVEMFRADADFGRTLHLSGIKVHATSSTAVDLTPMLCRGGSFVHTTQPEAFCTVLANPEGQSFGAGDGIVLRIVGEEPAVTVIDQVRLAFRENLHWTTTPAGSGAVVRVLP